MFLPLLKRDLSRACKAKRSSKKRKCVVFHEIAINLDGMESRNFLWSNGENGIQISQFVATILGIAKEIWMKLDRRNEVIICFGCFFCCHCVVVQHHNQSIGLWKNVINESQAFRNKQNAIRTLTRNHLETSLAWRLAGYRCRDFSIRNTLERRRITLPIFFILYNFSSSLFVTSLDWITSGDIEFWRNLEPMYIWNLNASFRAIFRFNSKQSKISSTCVLRKLKVLLKNKKR